MTTLPSHLPAQPSQRAESAANLADGVVDCAQALSGQCDAAQLARESVGVLIGNAIAAVCRRDAA